MPPCRRIIDPLIGHKACPGKRMYLLSKYSYLERCSQLSQVLPRLTSHQKMRKLSLFRVLLMETFGFLSPSFKMFLALLNNQIIMSFLGHIFITKCNNRTRWVIIIKLLFTNNKSFTNREYTLLFSVYLNRLWGEIPLGGWKFTDYKGLHDCVMNCDPKNVILSLSSHLLY